MVGGSVVEIPFDDCIRWEMVTWLRVFEVNDVVHKSVKMRGERIYVWYGAKLNGMIYLENTKYFNGILEGNLRGEMISVIVV